jgi:hypothetical protein
MCCLGWAIALLREGLQRNTEELWNDDQQREPKGTLRKRDRRVNL